MFHRCGCVDENGKRRVCVPPMNGYMCTRDALLIKKELVRQREKDNKDDITKAEAEVQYIYIVCCLSCVCVCVILRPTCMRADTF